MLASGSLKDDVLALGVFEASAKPNEQAGYEKELDVNGEKVVLTLVKA